MSDLCHLPLNLTVYQNAHIPNWDLVADVVNGVSRTHRSIKQCRARYENVIIPREEGRILYDVSPRKQKKNKSNYKVSGGLDSVYSYCMCSEKMRYKEGNVSVHVTEVILFFLLPLYLFMLPMVVFMSSWTMPSPVRVLIPLCCPFSVCCHFISSCYLLLQTLVPQTGFFASAF